jgi:formate-dependent nitrite reductase cytochrome c552 subunit
MESCMSTTQRFLGAMAALVTAASTNAQSAPSPAADVRRARWMAKRAGSKVTVVQASHAVHISHPRDVARVIETAVHAVR